MKSFILVVVAALVLAVPAVCQTLVQYDVPFEFLAGDKVMPAGTYTIETIGHGSAIALYGPRGAGQIFFAPSALDAATTRGFTRRMVFHLISNEYFLTEVWTSERGHQVSPGARYRRMLTSVRGDRIAIVLGK